MMYVTTNISHIVTRCNPELWSERGWAINMTMIMDIAFDIDEHICDEISSCIMDAVPCKCIIDFKKKEKEKQGNDLKKRLVGPRY